METPVVIGIVIGIVAVLFGLYMIAAYFIRNRYEFDHEFYDRNGYLYPGLSYSAKWKLWTIKDPIRLDEWRTIYSKDPTKYASVTPFITETKIDNRPIATKTSNIVDTEERLLRDGMCYTGPDGKLYTLNMSPSDKAAYPSLWDMLQLMYQDKRLDLLNLQPCA